jgi:hypothetical protein
MSSLAAIHQLEKVRYRILSEEEQESDDIE